MRAKLRQRAGDRQTFAATVGDFSWKRNRWGASQTILLKDLTDPSTGEVLTDHVWFGRGQWASDLTVGDRITFDARVTQYVKGYRGRHNNSEMPAVRVDYNLSHPTKVARIYDVVEAAA